MASHEVSVVDEPLPVGQTGTGVSRESLLRTWPGWVILGLTLVLTQVVPRWRLRTVEGFVSLVAGAPLGAVLLLVWWVGFSRARGADRWWNPLVYVVGGVLVWQWLFPGLDGSFLMVLGLPFVALVWLLALLGVGRRLEGPRRWWVTGAIAAAWGLLTLVRVEGTDGQINPRLGWRQASTRTWSPSPKAKRRALGGLTSTPPPARPPSTAAETMRTPTATWPRSRAAATTSPKPISEPVRP